MRSGVAVASILALMSSAGSVEACTLQPLNLIFFTGPAPFAAEVIEVRRVRERGWEQGLGPVREATFRLVGPVEPRKVPPYRWAQNNDCGSSYSVRAGQRVLLLLEADPDQARREHDSIMSSLAFEGAPLPDGGAEYREEVQVHPYTQDLVQIEELLDRYRR